MSNDTPTAKQPLMSEQPSSKELLPCPFCGKEAAVLGSNLIGCIDVVGCGAEVDLGHCTDYGPVVTQWNKRTAVPPSAGREPPHCASCSCPHWTEAPGLTETKAEDQP